MRRYIDAEELLERLPEDLPYKASVKRVLMQAPAADVIPYKEVERLERICESYALQYGTATDKEVFLKKERAETVKKMQERLINHFDECGAFTDMETEFIALEIDNVAEEFLRGR